MMKKPRCPVCGDDTNSYGQPFVSEWAVATHIAGKIMYARRDRLHKAWARQKAPEVDWGSVPQLAQELLLIVLQELEADQHPAAARTPLSLIHDIEVQLHRHIKHRLQAQFGDDGDTWWVKGVPLPIRQECVTRREADPDRKEDYAYTNLIDLKSILDKKWPLFESDFLKVGKVFSSKRELLSLLVRLNEVRNRYSHPVRAPRPDSRAFADDLVLASHVGEIMADFCNSAP